MTGCGIARRHDRRQRLLRNQSNRASESKAGAARVYATEDTYDFAARLLTLRQFRLLAEVESSELPPFVDHAFYKEQLVWVLSTVLHKAEMVATFSLKKPCRDT
jgi:hypothetical protein